MAESRSSKVPDIVSLNESWGDFDPNRVTVEELEQRFELSIAFPPIAGECSPNCNGCNLAVCCDCNQN